MFSATPTEALSISIDDDHYVFQSPQDFEFALTGRTCLPAAKIAALSRLDDDELLREAEATRAVEQRFAQTLSGAPDDVVSVGPFLEAMGSSTISQDNSWRSIINALNGVDRISESYKRIALAKYMQYLASRQEVVKSLYANRQPRKVCEGRPANCLIVYRPTVRFRETILIGLNENSDMGRHGMSFSRLPKGETVEVELEEDHAVDLLLAKHQCRILLRDRLLFVDQRGHDSELLEGRNVVGRDATSDVIIDASLRDVSRKHLIVESDGARQIKLTDISSHGTSLASMYLDHTSN
jgi:hypothetical protein